MNFIEADINITGSISVRPSSEEEDYLWKLYQTGNSDKRLLLMFGLSENWSAKVVDVITSCEGKDIICTFYIRGIRD